MEGVFASPIEVQPEGEPSVPRPEAAAGPQAAAQKLQPPLGAATPFARLRQPAALTPVMRRARAMHAKVLPTFTTLGSARMWHAWTMLCRCG